jgi:hypothetical protein
MKAGRIFDKSKCCHTNYEGMGVKKEELLKDSLIFAVEREDWEECLKLINKINKLPKNPRVFEFDAIVQELYNLPHEIACMIINKPKPFQFKEVEDATWHFVMKEIIEDENK